MARRNSFARALADAEKRLNKALAEYKAAKERILQLNREIPHLQLVITALKNDPPRDVVARRPEISEGEYLRAEAGRLAGPQDLSGIGSHQPSEDELLPEPEGIPLLEK